MKLVSIKVLGSLLVSTSLLSGCMTAEHLKVPYDPTVPPPSLMDVKGTAIPTFDGNSSKPVNGYQKLLPYLPYVIPVPKKNSAHPLQPLKFSTYVTENGQPNSLLYDDVFESMLVTRVSKASSVKTTARLSQETVKPFNTVTAKLASNYSVKSILTRTGYNTNKFTGVRQPYVATRYLVTSTALVRSSEIRDEILSAVYKRPAKPQSGMETLVKRKAFYVDLTTWSDVAAISDIHMSAWVHPVVNSQKEEDDWIDAREDFINSNAFIHFEK